MPCSKFALDVGYMQQMPHRVESEEVFILCPLWDLVGHLVCKQPLMVDPSKITAIVNLEAPRSVKQLHATLGNTGYYGKFIKAYAQITMSMERLLKKDATLYWDEEC